MMKTTEKKKRLLIAPVDGLRTCLLPSCREQFKPEPKDKKFCCPSHQRAGHKLAKKMGTLIVLSGTLNCECVRGVFRNGRKEANNE